MKQAILIIFLVLNTFNLKGQDSFTLNEELRNLTPAIPTIALKPHVDLHWFFEISRVTG